jgi:hypothetical protein
MIYTITQLLPKIVACKLLTTWVVLFKSNTQLAYVWVSFVSCVLDLHWQYSSFKYKQVACDCFRKKLCSASKSAFYNIVKLRKWNSLFHFSILITGSFQIVLYSYHSWLANLKINYSGSIGRYSLIYIVNSVEKSVMENGPSLETSKFAAYIIQVYSSISLTPQLSASSLPILCTCTDRSKFYNYIVHGKCTKLIHLLWVRYILLMEI